MEVPKVTPAGKSHLAGVAMSTTGGLAAVTGATAVPAAIQSGNTTAIVVSCVITVAMLAASCFMSWLRARYQIQVVE